MEGQFQSLAETIINGDADEAMRQTEQLIGEGIAARVILDDGLMQGMDVVGARMRAGEAFIPEVLLSARTMQTCLEVLKPLLAEGETSLVGTVVIGTVEGDVHDIGKNIVSLLLEGAGFEVVNLGTGVSADAFVAAVEERDADILGMSALLTTTIPRMAETMAALKSAGLRDKVKVLVGGAPVTAAFAEEIGADGTGASAAIAVERAKQLMAEVRA